MSEVYNPLLSSFNGLGKSSSIDFVNIGPLDKATAMSKVRLKLKKKYARNTTRLKNCNFRFRPVDLDEVMFWFTSQMNITLEGLIICVISLLPAVSSFYRFLLEPT